MKENQENNSILTYSHKYVVLPKWVRDEIGEVKDMLLIVDGDKHYLSPKTGKIL